MSTYVDWPSPQLQLTLQELGLMFEPHNVLSARILRDKNGVGRGVGFAR